MTRPDSPPAPVAASRARIWQGALGLLISAALLWWSLRGVSPADVLDHIRRARPGLILLGVLLATLCFPLRIPRWQLLLPADDGSRLPALPLWHAIAMGFTANNVLPLRAGELIRPYAVSRLAGVRFTSAFSSIAVERLFDGLSVVGLLTMALLLPGMPAEAKVAGIPIAALASRVAGICVLALLAAGAVLAWPLLAERIVRRVVPMHRLADRLVGLIEGIRQGLHGLRSPGRIVAVAAWSLALWGLNAVAYQIFFAAFDLPINFAGALVVQGILIFGISVPSTPGYLGVFEASIVAALSLYEVNKDQAATYAIVYHFTTFIPITTLGIWSVTRTGLGLRATLTT